jgi:dihydropteroate synthase
VRSLAPREHGAYGQLGFPLLTALCAAWPRPAGLLFAASAVTLFLAHEPALVAFGRRGERVRDEEGGRPLRVFLALLTAGGALGAAALWLSPGPARLGAAIAAGLAALLTGAVALGGGRAHHRPDGGGGAVESAPVRLVEIQNEADSLQACAAIGRTVPDANLRGWGALLARGVVAEGLRHSGLLVLEGSRGALALGSIAQIWLSGRSLADALEREPLREAVGELMRRAAAVETPAPASAWKLPRSRLPEKRTLVMGIVNATPDSFSDGGAYDPLAHALRLAEEGADILDVGGESTRPGAAPVDAAEERRRTEPVIRELARRTPLPISIDTRKAAVAAAALDAGAEIVNDVSGLRHEPELARAAAGAALCLMHMRGAPADMQSHAAYSDLLGEVQDELGEAVQRARAAGIPDERIVLDPGLGFAKTGAHNLTLLRRLRELTQLGRPLLAGASRKSFLGAATGKRALDRLFGSVAAAVVAASNGAAIVRVHDVQATREALAVVDAVRASGA